MTGEELYRNVQPELGADELARVLRLSRSHGGDHTRDRDEWRTGFTIDNVLDSVRRNR